MSALTPASGPPCVTGAHAPRRSLQAHRKFEEIMTRIRNRMSRRRFLAMSTAAMGIGAVGGIFRPNLSRAADRPIITHGLQSGDVSIDAGVVWARADRPSRMQIEIATTDSFKDIHRGAYVDALPESDFTAKLLVGNLPSGQDIFYRIRFKISNFQRLSASPWSDGFAPHHATGALCLSSGRVIKQVRDGVSTNSRGGMRTYATILREST